MITSLRLFLSQLLGGQFYPFPGGQFGPFSGGHFNPFFSGQLKPFFGGLFCRVFHIERHNSQWMDLMNKIAKAGPQNAAIIDVEKGLIEKDNSQILVIDDNLAQGIKWIKEGEFNETTGAPTLKLIGEVQPVDTVEVIRKERVNRLKEYPLSAKELAGKIKDKAGIGSNEVWRIINENKIKSNTDYALYNFRNKMQEERYEKDGYIPTGVPSIYKESAIDLIIKIFQNEH